MHLHAGRIDDRLRVHAHPAGARGMVERRAVPANIVGDLVVALRLAARRQLFGQNLLERRLRRDPAIDADAFNQGGDVPAAGVADEVARVDVGRLDRVGRAQANLAAALGTLQGGVRGRRRSPNGESAHSRDAGSWRRRAAGPVRPRAGCAHARRPRPRPRCAGPIAARPARPPANSSHSFSVSAPMPIFWLAPKAIGMLMWSCKSLPTPGRS